VIANSPPIAVLVNPANRIVTEIQKSDVEKAARLGSISFSLKPGANATSM
jgi:hypothetical protein